MTERTIPRIFRYGCLLLVSVACSKHGFAQAAPYRTFKKSGKIVLSVGDKGSFDSRQAKYPSILKIGDEWWMWYNGRTDDNFTGSIGLAKSTDGLNWVKSNDGKPVLMHGMKGTFDSTKVDHPSVLRFNGKFHMWYTAGDANSRYKIGYATSHDGSNWQRQNGGKAVLGPGKPGKFDDKLVLHPCVVHDPSGLLHIWYNGVGPQRSFRVGHATSRDGINWTRQNGGDPVLTPSRVGDFKEGYVYNVFVRIEGGRFHMWYSAWTENERTNGANHNGIIHAVSSNGNRWQKDSIATLTNGSATSIDGYACFACFIVDHGDEQWMYYSVCPQGSPSNYEVSLAKCRSKLQ